MIRQTASYGLGFTALFLSVVAILTSSSALFYMGTAVIAWIIGARIQAHLSVKNLEIERIVPEHAMVGETVVVEWVVKCTSKFRYPLVSLIDSTPRRMETINVSPSLPIAPNHRSPVRSQYQFQAMRRGVFQWSGVTVVGVDAIGIALATKEYKTSVSKLEVWPQAIRIPLILPHQAGSGRTDEGSGVERGGQEPRSIRDYVPGDSFRHVHWRSSAKKGSLLVKEFETGAALKASILIQRDSDGESDNIHQSLLDLACGQAIYLARELRRNGTAAIFPQFEDENSIDSVNRSNQISRLLTEVVVDSNLHFYEEARRIFASQGARTYYLFVSQAIQEVSDFVSLLYSGGSQVIVYVNERELKNPDLQREQSLKIYELESSGATVVVPGGRNVFSHAVVNEGKNVEKNGQVSTR